MRGHKRKEPTVIRRWLCLTVLICSFAAQALWAQQYSVEPSEGPAPADVASAEIIAQLAPRGYRVTQDSGRSIWDFWPAKEWSVEAGFVGTAARQHPLAPGELIGLVVLPRRGADFRDQTLSRGAYTLRYALQPVDGNHVGTSPTQDFLLYVKAEDDPTPAAMSAEQLIEASAKAAGSSHPAMLCLQKLNDDAPAPAIRWLEEQQWAVLRITNPAQGEAAPVTLDLVIVGHAAE
jgi:hypothetical protein